MARERQGSVGSQERSLDWTGRSNRGRQTRSDLPGTPPAAIEFEIRFAGKETDSKGPAPSMTHRPNRAPSCPGSSRGPTFSPPPTNTILQAGVRAAVAAVTAAAAAAAASSRTRPVHAPPETPDTPPPATRRGDRAAQKRPRAQCSDGADCDQPGLKQLELSVRPACVRQRSLVARTPDLRRPPVGPVTSRNHVHVPAAFLSLFSNESQIPVFERPSPRASTPGLMNPPCNTTPAHPTRKRILSPDAVFGSQSPPSNYQPPRRPTSDEPAAAIAPLAWAALLATASRCYDPSRLRSQTCQPPIDIPAHNVDHPTDPETRVSLARSLFPPSARVP
ncbi:hypothetical protein HETIRDRAFT_107099 [Heterobasidion irregulare TC 32-1]|uniref:Uncharacterized protein n=1 Tax=Heterobasidion irregulare (strain TC 32-1) TaxID=747525 RepID=W4KAT5_HETIT|nr:uncharacterized protein HETIRDRAFT_107099 [Heterobasidion irregulare TC 32-1]ETW82942.1 hypothetical protein HETIRDRAFT_107099 [Heterobasidion irregulare TC 32-1]